MNWKSFVLIIVCLLIGLFLYYYDPVKSNLAPKCWFKVFTGLSCPGCGFQRCVHALLHGNLWEAIGYNIFLAVGIPFLAFVAVCESVGLNFSTLLIKRSAAYLYLFLYFTWFVVRNVYEI